MPSFRLFISLKDMAFQVFLIPEKKREEMFDFNIIKPAGKLVFVNITTDYSLYVLNSSSSFIYLIFVIPW